MKDTVVEGLLVDLLEWIGPAPRPCAEVLDAWRTSCPRLPVWEEANTRGLVRRVSEAGCAQRVEVTPQGRAFLDEHHRTSVTARPKAAPLHVGG